MTPLPPDIPRQKSKPPALGGAGGAFSRIEQTGAPPAEAGGESAYFQKLRCTRTMPDQMSASSNTAAPAAAGIAPAGKVMVSKCW